MHVALPDLDGPVTSEWIANGAQVHRIDYTLSPLRPFAALGSLGQLQRLVDVIQPDLIHSHHVTAAIIARLALRERYPVPRIFQVPGPYHMEKFPFRLLELSTATADDYWIATSRAIQSHYLRAGISNERVFLSYAGTENERFRRQRTGQLRRRLGLADSEFLVGNISYVYAPKWYYMQRVGVKCHEDLIDGISLAAEKDRSIRGVLIGGPWGTDPAYFEKLRLYARKRSGNAVIMPGAFNQEEVVDLTELCSDPVDLLFGVQLGGAEDYWKATCYCERFMHTPAKTLYVLLADLHDTSPNTSRFVKKMEFLLESGVKAIGLLAISDQGTPSYNESLARTLANLGMPCFGCTPDRLPELLAGVLRGSDLKALAAKLQ